MRILKSRVEMTPEELIKSRAGQTCVCGCQQGFDSEGLFVGSEEGGFFSCACGCVSTSGVAYEITGNGAGKYPELMP